ncbi:LuxR family transcriptional regulator [Agromyces sp. Root81]|uniref:response regulator n=1 Tax=Agromyces sp. Root81 TaxID=1736601 RepID=UPI0006F5645F|nr:response regulator transcription factor [Agromyces sp. Root81]KRC63161.1 LuxR family transcriptional regulator [Agromyces sp. Root81]
MDHDIRLLLVDDEWLVRAGLRTMLGGQPGITIVGEAGDGTGVAELAQASGANLVLMDIRMPRMNGVEATKEIRALADPPHVVILTTFDHDSLVLRALRAGASGFLLKDMPPPELVAAIRRITAGDQVLSPAVLRKLILRFTEPGPAPARDKHLALLTPAEQRIALAVTRGRSNAEIAAELSVSVTTVKTHVSSILGKLGVSNRVQIALMLNEHAPAESRR